MGQNELTITRAREHNLKNISLVLPRGKLVVVTGPSGSGKSSLAFDTLYAEGQRRYVESLSVYARQFLEQLPKPDVDLIEGLSPAVAIEQKSMPRSPRSTVGTVTEIADYLRLLFARKGTPHCPSCGKVISAASKAHIETRILARAKGTKLQLLAPIARQRRGELRLELDRLRRDGFVRAIIDGTMVDLGDDLHLEKNALHNLDVVIDRLVLKDGIERRLSDSVELALKLGEGQLIVAPEGEAHELFSDRFACLDCNRTMPPLEPRLFSFNSPAGACPACQGLGVRNRIEPLLLTGDEGKTLREGVMLAWGARGSVAYALELSKAVEQLGVDPDVSWKKLDPKMREALLQGSPEVGKKKVRAYVGIIPRIEEKIHADSDGESGEGELDERGLRSFLVEEACSVCRGTRLSEEARAVRIDEKNIADVSAFSLDALDAFALDLGNKVASDAVLVPLVSAIRSRLRFLSQVGLEYLSLDRPAGSLSGGEGQRIRLATQLGAELVGVLYVLDEPSAGLHARDHSRLLQAERWLVDRGNTLVVVEHDREAIMAADHLVDMGPGAGVHGGEVLAQGTPAEVMKMPRSVTGPYLSGKKRLPLPKVRRVAGKNKISLKGVRAHNLKGIDVEIPIGLLVSVTGVSGSGKSTLIEDVLLRAAQRALYASKRDVPAQSVEGLGVFEKVIQVDAVPLGRTPRSNAATYTGIFSELRDLFAQIPESRARGYKPGRFSFNVKGGRCELCKGDGVKRVEMHFLPDVFVECTECKGKRFNSETLEIRYRGLSIADVLALTAEDAARVFEAIPGLALKLGALVSVGLGYLLLGQSATTLSGGEAQRVKLARELAKKSTGQTLYVFDEPTAGLHFVDIELLLDCLFRLRDQGNTVVVVEHHLDVIAASDWVIDLGPEGGPKGGNIVCVGTPEAVAKHEGSHTGRFLRTVLERALARQTS